MAKEKAISFTSGIVTLVYPKLNEPDVYTPKRGKPGKPKFKTDWSEPDEAAEVKLQDYLRKQAKKLCPDADFSVEGKDGFGFPWKLNKEDALVFTTSTGMTNKQGILIRPPIYDAKNQAIPVDAIIGGGTKARLNMSIGVYPDEDGITLYLNQVQVVDLVESSYGKSVFDVAEGFSYKGAGAAENADLESSDLDASEDDDELDVAF